MKTTPTSFDYYLKGIVSTESKTLRNFVADYILNFQDENGRNPLYFIDVIKHQYDDGETLGYHIIEEYNILKFCTDYYEELQDILDDDNMKDAIQLIPSYNFLMKLCLFAFKKIAESIIADFQDIAS